MALSKKEISILIEIVFSIAFAFIFLPYFYENLDNNLVLMDDLSVKIIEIVIFSVIYFSVAYSLLEFFKKTETKDERDDMINSKSYKLGYLLHEFFLFIFIGTLSSNFKNQELLNLTDVGIIFLIFILLIFISFVKSSYQLYLHRTS